MNNNFNQNGYNQNNGQFGGWVNNTPYTTNNYQAPNGYANYNQPQVNQERKKDKKILNKMGICFGLCIIAYAFFARGMATLIYLLSQRFSALNLLYDDSTASYAYSIVGSVLYIGVPFMLAYLYLKRKKIAGILPFGTTYNNKASFSMTLLFIPFMVFTSIAVNIIFVIVQELLGVTFTSGLEDLSIDGVGGFIIATLSMAVIPAIVEETAIRGIVLQPLRRYGDTFAIVMSAFIFSIMHGNMAQIPYTMTGGLILGYLTVATGSIWPSIIVHFVNNFYSVVVLAISSSFGENMSVITTGVIMLLFVVFGVVGAVCFFPMRYKVHLAKGVNTLKISEKVFSLLLSVPMILALVIMFSMTLSSIK